MHKFYAIIFIVSFPYGSTIELNLKQLLPSSRSFLVMITRKKKKKLIFYLRKETKGVLTLLVNVATGILKTYNQEAIGLTTLLHFCFQMCFLPGNPFLCQ